MEKIFTDSLPAWRQVNWKTVGSLIYKIMMITAGQVLLMAVTMNIALAWEGYSQKVLDRKVSLEISSQTLKEALKALESQAGVKFVYSGSALPLSEKVNITAADESLGTVLDELLEPLEMRYVVKGKTHIVLKRAKNGEEIVEAEVNPKDSPIAEELTLQTISGTVVDASTQQPLPGVNIIEKGTTQGTTTDADGKYTLSVTEDAILVFSFIGYIVQEVPLNGRFVIDVVLTPDIKSLEEVVVIGYGSQKRSAVTGAIATMEAEDLANVPVTKLSNALEGRLSGVYVNQASGAPGYSANVRVRSLNTWKTSGTEPLYVIDGIISTKQQFNVLDATEVKDITVLKDAASAAVYGARGGNGVILITTNSGSAGKFKLSYSYSYSFDRPTNLPKYVDAKDMVRLHNYARELSGAAPMYGPQEIAHYNENDPARALFDEVYRDPTLQKHSISASGGGEKVKYFINGSSTGQTAFVKNADFKRYNLRSNINVDFTENLTGFFNVTYYQSKKSRFVMQEDLLPAREDGLPSFEVDDTFGKFWARLQFLQPHAPPRTSDGKLINPGWIGNALGFVEEGGTNHRTEYNVNTIMSLTYKVPFIEGLSFSAKYSPSFYTKQIKHYEKKMTLYNVEKTGEHGLIYTDNVIGSTQSSYPSKERLVKSSDTKKNYQLNFSANYQKTFGKHNIDAMFNIETAEGVDDYFYGARENFPLFYKDQFWATGSSRSDSYVGGSEYESGRMSYIGRISYDYADKYFLNATLRRDGSMLFAPAYRWGNFPSVSLGWVLSNEEFMSSSFLDFLKIRTSWGLAGNDAVGGWEWAESYNPNGNYLMGTTSLPRVSYNGIVNDKLTWEKTREFNIGIDSRLSDGITFSAEYFNRHNYDILDRRIVSLPASFGGDMPPTNYGIVNGHGLEIDLGYYRQAGEFSYEVKGNFSYSTNKVVERDIPENVRDVDNPVGRSTDYVKALVSNGIIRTQADLDKIPEGYTIYGRKPKLGDIWFEDVSGLEPGVPDGKIDDYDKQVIQGKHYLPRYTYGLNLRGSWKGFSLDIFFQGFMGVSKMWAQDYGSRRFPDETRPADVWLDSWSEGNVNASLPRPHIWGDSENHQESTFWLKDGDYVRLKFVNLSYTVPKSLINNLRISNVTLTASGTNLLTLSGFKDYDPNISSMGSYPIMKSYSFGINVTF